MSFTDKGLDIANQHIHYAEYVLIQRPKLLVQKSLREIADVAYLRDNRLSDASFRRDGPRGQRIVADRRQRDVEDSVLERPQNRTQVVESQAFTCRIQLALFALFSAWFTNAGSGVTLGAGAWTLDGGRSRLRRPIRCGFLFSGFRRWGRLAIRGPFRCKHRIKHRKRGPGRHGNCVARQP